jgi:hypothetical protein
VITLHIILNSIRDQLSREGNTSIGLLMFINDLRDRLAKAGY